jgi:hypothetical protein
MEQIQEELWQGEQQGENSTHEVQTTPQRCHCDELQLLMSLIGHPLQQR